MIALGAILSALFTLQTKHKQSSKLYFTIALNKNLNIKELWIYGASA